MIALWMLHTTLLGALLALAALLAERARRPFGRPLRPVWAAALALAVVLPAARLAGAGRPAPAPAAVGGVTLDVGALPAGTRASALAGGRLLDTLLATEAIAAPAAWLRLDRPLALAWAVGTLALALWLLVTARRTAARLRRWPERELDGGMVRVAPDVGPAVFGAVRTTVIVPQWALADGGLPLMLAHERAHVRARDPLLLAAALAAVALMPWNVAAWWMLRRLRLAVELDCDARVLALVGGRAEAVRRYGALLLDVARRASGGAPASAVLAPTLLATPSTLTRRIHAMTTPPPRRALPRALPAAAGAALLVAAACELPRPTGPKAEARAPLARIGEGATTPASGDAAAVQEASVARLRRVLRQAYPDALGESTGGIQRYWVVQEAGGRVSRVMRGTVPADAPANTRLSNATLLVERDGRYVATPITPADADGAGGIEADAIASVDVLKQAAGRLGPDRVEAIWVRLKGADTREAQAALVPPGGRAIATVRDGDKVATVRPIGPDGRPSGAPSVIRLRTSRDSTAPRPLYLVDGVEFDGTTGTLPTSDRIESIEVLKGEAARREYGARGTDGVIRIRTRP